MKKIAEAMMDHMADIDEVIESNIDENQAVLESGLTASRPEWDDVLLEIEELDSVGSYLNDKVIRSSFTGDTIAGQDVAYEANRWGQYSIYVDDIELKGRTKGVILTALYNNYFDKVEEKHYGGMWFVVTGYITCFEEEDYLVQFLLRGGKVLGMFKHNANVERAIKWYAQHVYSEKPQDLYLRTTNSYGIEYENEVYDGQQFPEFTREDELEEILEFIESLSHRNISVDERNILTDISKAVDRLLLK